MAVSDFVSFRDRLVEACSQAIVGKTEQITMIAVCYLCGGHILLEDVPGVGKTTLALTFSKILELIPSAEDTAAVRALI